MNKFNNKCNKCNTFSTTANNKKRKQLTSETVGTIEEWNTIEVCSEAGFGECVRNQQFLSEVVVRWLNLTTASHPFTLHANDHQPPATEGDLVVVLLLVTHSNTKLFYKTKIKKKTTKDRRLGDISIVNHPSSKDQTEEKLLVQISDKFIGWCWW